MALHLVKLCVGVSSVEELEAWCEQRLEFGKRVGTGEDAHIHRTRMTPKRANEIVGQGSLYWVIGGKIACRQPIVDLVQSQDDEGKRMCHIVMAPQIIRTVPFPKRPFQGWRYLQNKDAPADLIGKDGQSEGDEQIAAELAELGLI